MAKINDNKLLSGAVGNLVFRTLEGQQIVQAAPGKIRQSKRTKQSGSEFRQCSKWGKQLRWLLHDFLARQTDTYMHRRLTTALYQTILSNTQLLVGERTPFNCDMKGMEGFEWNTHSPMQAYFQAPLQTTMLDSGHVEIAIPSFKPNEAIKFPKRIHEVELLLYVFAVQDLQSYTLLSKNIFVAPFHNNHTPTLPQTFQTETPMPAGAWVLALAKIQFYTHNAFVGKKYENTAQLSPTQIVFSGRG
ncbi:MAG: hypothetical protein ACOVLC_05885 [Flavobacterium sp.]